MYITQRNVIIMHIANIRNYRCRMLHVLHMYTVRGPFFFFFCLEPSIWHSSIDWRNR